MTATTTIRRTKATISLARNITRVAIVKAQEAEPEEECIRKKIPPANISTLTMANTHHIITSPVVAVDRILARGTLLWARMKHPTS